MMITNPTLLVFAGLPATGKTTLAKMLAKHLQATYVRVDTIEQTLIQYQCFNDDTAGYKLAYEVAKENLRLNSNVIADGVNPVLETRQGWRDVANESNAAIIEIEITCSDPAGHKNRVETRTADIVNHNLPTWNTIQKRNYQSWNTPVITIDTAFKSVDESFQDLLNSIKPCLQENHP